MILKMFPMAMLKIFNPKKLAEIANNKTTDKVEKIKENIKKHQISLEEGIKQKHSATYGKRFSFLCRNRRERGIIQFYYKKDIKNAIENSINFLTLI